jgi:hypothetical protein
MKGNVNINTLEKPLSGSNVYKEGAKDFGRLIIMLIGGIVFLIGLLLLIGSCLFRTIIGAFIGIGAMFLGFIIVWAITPKVKVECPACETSKKIVSGVRSYKCGTCKQTVVVKWIEKQTNIMRGN